MTWSLEKVWGSPGPDSYYSWVICFACFWVHLFAGGYRNCQGNLFVIIQQTQGVTREVASWPNTCLSLTSSLSALFSGFLNHYFGWRKVLYALSVIGTLGFLGAFLSPSTIGWTNFYQAIIGLAMGPVFPTLVKVSASFFVKHRSKAQNIFSAGNPISSILFPIVMDYVAGFYSLRGIFLVMGSLYIQSFIFIALLRPKTKQQFPEYFSKQGTINGLLKDRNHNLQTTKDSTGSPAVVEEPMQEEIESRSATEYLKQLKQLFCNLTFYLFLVATTVDFSVVMIVFFIIIDHGMDCGLSSSNATMLVVTISIGDCLGRTVAGWLIDKQFISLAKSYALACLMQAVIYVGIAYANSVPLLFGACFLNGVVFCFCSGVRTMMTTNLFGLEKAATIAGLMMCLLGFFTTLSPLFIGFFREGLGSYCYMFLLFSAVSVLLSLTMFIIDCLVKRSDRTAKEVQEQQAQPA